MRRASFAAVAAAVLLIALGAFAPKWLLFLATMATSNGLAVLGIFVLMRGGGASFGQGMFFAIGAYVAALAPQALGVTDARVRGRQDLQPHKSGWVAVGLQATQGAGRADACGALIQCGGAP